MDIRQLRYLVAVADHGSFAAAARSLGITQQALGQSMAALEAELGVKLFNRGPPTVATVFGRSLLRHAQAINAEMDRSIADISQLKGASAGEVRIGVGEIFAGFIAPQAIAAFHARNPGVKIYITENYTKTLLTLLEAGDIDFAVSAPAGHNLTGPNIIQEIVGEVFEGVLARTSHPLFNRKNLAVADLQGYTWLVPTDLGEAYETVLETFVDANVPPPDRVVWSDSTAAGTALLLANDYLIFVAEAMFHSLIDAGLVAALPLARPRRRRRLSIWTRANSSLAPAATTMIAEIRAVIEAENLREMRKSATG